MLRHASLHMSLANMYRKCQACKCQQDIHAQKMLMKNMYSLIPDIVKKQSLGSFQHNIYK